MSIKCLFIGHQYEDSGWGESSRNIIKAMNRVGIDVVPRPIILSGNRHNVGSEILQLEAKSPVGCNYVIQNILPHYMSYDGRFIKNIAYTYLDLLFSEYGHRWLDSISLMDEIWCPRNFNNISEWQKAAIVPLPLDIKEPIHYKPMSLPNIQDDTIVFYCICDINKRKNIAQLLTAFHTAFLPHDNVALLIKTNGGHQALEAFTNDANEIKKSLKLYSDMNYYHNELLITDKLSREEILYLHHRCDVYVDISHGEAFNIPLHEAQAFGNDIITHDYNSQFMDYCSDYVNTFVDNGTGLDKWLCTTTESVVKNMKSVYNKLIKQNKQVKKIDNHYSFEAVGTKILELLNA